MTSEEFNNKYSDYIPQGWSGLEFDIPEVTEYLDKLMEDLIQIPGFELHQVKLKFGMARFYFETGWNDKSLEAVLQFHVEDTINELIKK